MQIYAKHFKYIKYTGSYYAAWMHGCYYAIRGATQAGPVIAYCLVQYNFIYLFNTICLIALKFICLETVSCGNNVVGHDG